MCGLGVREEKEGTGLGSCPVGCSACRHLGFDRFQSAFCIVA